MNLEIYNELITTKVKEVLILKDNVDCARMKRLRVFEGRG